MEAPTNSWASQVMDSSPSGEGYSPYLDVDQFPRAMHCLNSEIAYLDTTTLFGSYQEALDWRSSIVHHPQENDPTIPRTNDQKKALVKLLFMAFKSIAVATDNEPMIKPFREHRHDNARVEVLCWMILEASVRRAETGPLVYSWDPSKAKCNNPLRSFAERFDEMITSMATSKTICKHLYDAPYSNHFVDDPISARKRVLSNRELNKRKGAMMAQGRKVQEEAKNSLFELDGSDGKTGTAKAKLLEPIKLPRRVQSTPGTVSGKLESPYNTQGVQTARATASKEAPCMDGFSNAAPSAVPMPFSSLMAPFPSTTNENFQPELSTFNYFDTTNPFVPQNTDPMSSALASELPNLNQPFSFDEEFSALLNDQHAFTGLGILSTQPTQGYALPTQQASVFSAPGVGNRQGSTESYSSPDAAARSDKDDPDWHPGHEAKKRRH